MFDRIVSYTLQYLELFNFVDFSQTELFEVELFDCLIVRI